MPRGNFICFRADGKVSTHMSSKMSWLSKEPKIEHFPVSYEPVMMSERVLFVGDDGSVWVLKDRFIKHGQLLPPTGEGYDFHEVPIDLGS